MTEPKATPSHPPMLGKRTATILGGALLAGFAGMHIFTVHDAAHRPALESVAEPRAVGDDRFFPLTQKLVADQPLANFGGKSLIVADLELDEPRDSVMEKAGLDDTGAFYIYRKLEPDWLKRQSKKQQSTVFFFLKVANGSYVKTRLKPE